jgi:hypothetical protein
LCGHRAVHAPVVAADPTQRLKPVDVPRAVEDNAVQLANGQSLLVRVIVKFWSLTALPAVGMFAVT